MAAQDPVNLILVTVLYVERTCGVVPDIQKLRLCCVTALSMLCALRNKHTSTCFQVFQNKPKLPGRQPPSLTSFSTVLQQLQRNFRLPLAHSHLMQPFPPNLSLGKCSQFLTGVSSSGSHKQDGLTGTATAAAEILLVHKVAHADGGGVQAWKLQRLGHQLCCHSREAAADTNTQDDNISSVLWISPVITGLPLMTQLLRPHLCTLLCTVKNRHAACLHWALQLPKRAMFEAAKLPCPHLSGWNAATSISCCKTVNALDTATGTASAAPAAAEATQGAQILASCSLAAVTSSGKLTAICSYAAALSAPSQVGAAAAALEPLVPLLGSPAAAALLLPLTTELLQLRSTAHSCSGNCSGSRCLARCSARLRWSLLNIALLIAP